MLESNYCCGGKIKQGGEQAVNWKSIDRVALPDTH